MMDSLLCVGSEPSSLATTFRELTVRKTLVMANRRGPQELGWKSRLDGCLLERIQIAPARREQLFRLVEGDPALDRDSRGVWPVCGWAMSKFSRLQLPLTTSNGYPAGPVSWTRMAAAAPFSEAISNLYVHRP